MALYPNSFQGQFKLQPGARGERFKADMPGYRGQDDRINRSNMRLNMNEHDTPNIKYMFDNRLPVLFRYGFSYGFSQITIPKGRICGIDGYLDLVDFDMLKQHNTLTLANGGAPVRLRTDADKYKNNYTQAENAIVSQEAQGVTLANTNIEFMPIIGMNDAYDDITYRPFKTAGPIAQLTTAGLKIDPETGYVVEVSSGNTRRDVIPGNHPIGVLTRNEYTRDDDAMNGMAPGSINTDCMLELPWFAYKDKAEGNPWGSCYGGLFPGCLVKSDENGRVVPSPLSFEKAVAEMTISEYELERQQIIGQVYAVNTELVPEGAARWCTWALEDRLAFSDFNPEEYPQNNRRGEDAIARSAHKTTGKYPGYPYDKNYGAHDLHMLGAGRGNYDQRMNQEYQYENLGIPGLTDGYNAVKRDYDAVQVGTVQLIKGATDSVDLFFRFPEVKVEDMKISIGSLKDEHFTNLIEKAMIDVRKDAHTGTGAIECKYADELQGLFVVKTAKNTVVDTFLEAVGVEKLELPVYVKFAKRGLAGVPTFLDWEGAIGSCKILLQK